MKRILFRSGVLLLCLFVFCAVLFSCEKKDPELVGRWETQIEDEDLGRFSMVYHFTEEGKIFLEQKKGAEIPFSIPFGNYQVQGNKVLIESDGEETSFTFSVSENELKLVDPEKNEVVFLRIEAE